MQTSIRDLRLTAGVDEVGRGPLAGPVVAAAVVCLLPIKASLIGRRHLKLRDSKQLSAKQREHYYRLFLKDPALQWGIGRVGARTIDKINIFQATRLAMKRAVSNLSKKARPAFLLVDGTLRIETQIPQKAVIRGDEKIALCAMASIVAKVTRDRLMQKYHRLYPEYGFHRHKGYGTRAHLRALKRHGVSPIHRRSFRPGRLKQLNLRPCRNLPAMLE